MNLNTGGMQLQQLAIFFCKGLTSIKGTPEVLELLKDSKGCLGVTGLEGLQKEPETVLERPGSAWSRPWQALRGRANSWEALGVGQSLKRIHMALWEALCEALETLGPGRRWEAEALLGGSCCFEWKF